MHSNCLLQVQEMLEHNDFLTSQSQKIQEFTVHGKRISISRLYISWKNQIFDTYREEKFNGYIIEYIYNYYEEHGTYPAGRFKKEKPELFSGYYRISDYNCIAEMSSEAGQNLEEEEMKYLYQIANALPGFLEERGLQPKPAKESGRVNQTCWTAK